MSQAIAGTFTNGASASSTPAQFSPGMLIPRGAVTAKLTTSGCNASNTMKTQKRTVPGAAFVDQATFNSEQAGTAITVAEGEEWQLACVALTAMYALGYKLTVEN